MMMLSRGDWVARIHHPLGRRSDLWGGNVGFRVLGFFLIKCLLTTMAYDKKYVSQL